MKTTCEILVAIDSNSNELNSSIRQLAERVKTVEDQRNEAINTLKTLKVSCELLKKTNSPVDHDAVIQDITAVLDRINQMGQCKS